MARGGFVHPPLLPSSTPRLPFHVTVVISPLLYGAHLGSIWHTEQLIYASINLIFQTINSVSLGRPKQKSYPQLNPLPPSDAVWQQKKIFLRIFSVQYYLNVKKYHPSGNLKFFNLGILKSLKLRTLVKKNPSKFS